MNQRAAGLVACSADRHERRRRADLPADRPATGGRDRRRLPRRGEPGALIQRARRVPPHQPRHRSQGAQPAGDRRGPLQETRSRDVRRHRGPRPAAEAAPQRVRRPVPDAFAGRGRQGRDHRGRGRRDAAGTGRAVMTAAASLSEVTMRFRGHTALTEVSTTIQADTITGLLGRNGAGKTTMMQLLTGHRLPTSGQVRVLGQSPYENDAVLSRLCFVKESQRYPDHFRVWDAVSAAAAAFPAWDREFAAALVDDFQLPVKRTIKKRSRGMPSAVGFVLGLATRAPVTLFDEPYLGLDAVARQLFYDRLLTDYAEHPRTIVLSTHLIEEISDLLEHVLLIDRGRVLLDADAETLRATALTVSGPARQVAIFGTAHQLLQMQSLAGQSRAIVHTGTATSRRMATDLGLTVEATSIQQLVVAMSRASATSAGAPAAVLSDLQGVSR